MLGGVLPPASGEPQRLLHQAIDPAAHLRIREDLRPALRDPFEQVLAQTTPALPPPMVEPPVVQAVPVQSLGPTSPPLTYVGRMRAVHGGWLVMAQLGADGVPVALVVGKELGNGYRVERMSDHVVELLNPHTQNVMQLAVPAVPRFETW